MQAHADLAALERAPVPYVYERHHLLDRRPHERAVVRPARGATGTREQPYDARRRAPAVRRDGADAARGEPRRRAYAAQEFGPVFLGNAVRPEQVRRVERREAAVEARPRGRDDEGLERLGAHAQRRRRREARGGRVERPVRVVRDR